MKRTAEGAQRVFARSVRENLHIIVLWGCDRSGLPFDGESGPGLAKWLESTMGAVAVGNSTAYGTAGTGTEASLREVFASLVRSCSHIDHYQAWSRQAYTDVAIRYWQSSERYSWQEWIETGDHSVLVLALSYVYALS